MLILDRCRCFLLTKVLVAFLVDKHRHRPVFKFEHRSPKVDKWLAPVTPYFLSVTDIWTQVRCPYARYDTRPSTQVSVASNCLIRGLPMNQIGNEQNLMSYSLNSIILKLSFLTSICISRHHKHASRKLSKSPRNHLELFSASEIAFSLH